MCIICTLSVKSYAYTDTYTYTDICIYTQVYTPPCACTHRYWHIHKHIHIFINIHTTKCIMTVWPDILEREVKWALGSITMKKPSGGDGISVELFQILKDVAAKALHSIFQQIWKTQPRPQHWKSPFSFQSERKTTPKNAQTTVQLCFFHILARLCSKSFKLDFSSTWTKNFQMYKQGFEEAGEPEIKLSTFTGSWRKQGSSRKTSTSASLTILMPLTVWITANCGKFLKRWK